MNKTTKTLTQAQRNALYKFSQAGGHGFGEYSFITKPTARVLQRLGLIEVSYQRGWELGTITDAGRAVLIGLA